MKIFDRDEKINFVDKNNVFVGYDTSQNCCETVDWFISKIEENKARYEKEDIDLDDYIFDTNYFEEIRGEDFDEGGMVRFKMTAKDKPNLYLHLFNCHNGYYRHGFESKIGEEKWKEDYL